MYRRDLAIMAVIYLAFLAVLFIAIYGWVSLLS